MPVPDFESLLLPVLRLFASGAKNVRECLPVIQRDFGITDEEAEELLPSGRVTTLQSRVHWARTYLSKAGLLESPRRNMHMITQRGREVLVTAPARIDVAYLDRFDGFREWRKRSGTEDSAPTPLAGQVSPHPSIPSQTPDDAMRVAYSTLNAALRDDLVGLLQRMSPVQFERLILDLLAAMGYGGGDLSSGRMTRTSGDHGIDGVINEDALGLDAVFIQAKRYAPENRVGRPDLQRFVGSLTGEGASKGVFVTTSDFSREAAEYVGRVQQRIRLINGNQLAELLIQHGVGVRTRLTYAIKSIDEDYFSEVD